MTALTRAREWARSQRWVTGAMHGLGLRTLGHSTVIWFQDSDACHTRITMRNYLNANYGIDRAVCRFRLHDRDGRGVREWRELLSPETTLVLESRRLLEHLGVPGSFEGSLAMEIQDWRLEPPRYLRVNVDYYNERGLITTVHDQARLVRRPRPDAQSTVYVREDDDFGTSIILQNPYCYRRHPDEYLATAQLELLNSAGDKRHAVVAGIPACGWRRVCIAEAFPDASEFLAGRVGGLRIRSNISMARSLPMLVSRQSGHFAVSHTTGDNDPSVHSRDLLDVGSAPTCPWAPIWSSFVEESDSFHTEIAIFNNWLPRGVYSIDVRLFDADGRRQGLVHGALTLQPDETKTLSMYTLIRQAGAPLPFRGIVEARIAPRVTQGRLPGPGMLQVNTVWSTGGHVSQSTNQSLWHANTTADLPPLFSPLLAPRRTKMFGRVVANRHHETILSLQNPSSDDEYGMASDTEVEVSSASGRRRLTSRLSVPPHGSVWIPLESLMPDLATFLGESEGVSSVSVRDLRVKLIGYLGLRDRFYGTIGIDHLFGG